MQWGGRNSIMRRRLANAGESIAFKLRVYGCMHVGRSVCIKYGPAFLSLSFTLNYCVHLHYYSLFAHALSASIHLGASHTKALIRVTHATNTCHHALAHWLAVAAAQNSWNICLCLLRFTVAVLPNCSDALPLCGCLLQSRPFSFCIRRPTRPAATACMPTFS